MKKKQAVFTLVACSIAALVLTGVLLVGLSSGGFGLGRLRREHESGMRREDGQYRYEYAWDLEESRVTGLDVEWINGPVEIKTGGEGRIRIVESAGWELKDNEKLQLSSSGGVLKIKWEGRIINFSLFQNRYKSLTVEVPQAVAEAMEELTCSTTSGNVTVSGFTAREWEVSTASGDMELSGIAGEEGSLSTASGSVTVEDGRFSQELHANTTSGPMTFSRVEAGQVDLNTVSGAVTYQGSAEDFEADSVSAAVRGELDNCPEEADLSSVSGGLLLAIPENKGFQVEYSSISGEFSTDFPVTEKAGRAVYASGGAEFSFSTTSGNMEVRKRERAGNF